MRFERKWKGTKKRFKGQILMSYLSLELGIVGQTRLFPVTVIFNERSHDYFTDHWKIGLQDSNH